MNDLINKYRFTVKPVSLENSNSLELARSIQVHPLTYQELPYDPEYSNYSGRLTLEKLSNVSPEEMYWKARREIIFRHTGEHPFEISGPDALKFLQKKFNFCRLLKMARTIRKNCNGICCIWMCNYYKQ